MEHFGALWRDAGDDGVYFHASILLPLSSSINMDAILKDSLGLDMPSVKNESVRYLHLHLADHMSMTNQ